MVTLTSLTVLSGLLFGATFPDTIIKSDKSNIENNKNEIQIIESYDMWSKNSIAMELSGQHTVGTASQKVYSQSAIKHYEVANKGVVPVSAYSSTPDQTDDTPFIMASGRHVYDGAIAANFLPLGAKVRFPDLYGDKIFMVEDRMNKRYSYKMDVWMGTRQQALNFGVKNLRYEVVVDGGQILAVAK